MSPTDQRDSAWSRPLVKAAAATVAGVVLLAIGIIVARWFRDQPFGAEFVAAYPGDTDRPAGMPVGFPAWLAWQHFLNGFLLLFIVRTGFQIRSKVRPPAFRTRSNTGLLRTKNPPRRLTLWTWFHLVLDTVWVANGVVYVVLLFVSGQWMRLVPMSWDVIPHAVSVGIQYLSLDWPTHDGWVHYNALQLLLYGATVFLAAPLALATGLRLSPVWPARWRFPSERLTRTLHVLVMVYFLGFTAVHVALVLATGALRNLNHMYALRDDESWVGFWVFAASIAVMAIAWFVLRPAVLIRLAGIGGTVRR